MVARIEGYTHAAEVWALSLVQGPFSVVLCGHPMLRFTFPPSPYGERTLVEPRHALDCYVVRLGGSGGEDDLLSVRAHQLRQLPDATAAAAARFSGLKCSTRPRRCTASPPHPGGGNAHTSVLLDWLGRRKKRWAWQPHSSRGCVARRRRGAHLLARYLASVLALPTVHVRAAVRVAVLLRHERHHRVQHARVQWRRGLRSNPILSQRPPPLCELSCW
jgi:hypothetical protein